MTLAASPLLWCWRHPRAVGASGRCIGRTDIPVDPRKARRLAHCIRTLARRRGLPRVVWVSPLARSRDVGRQLARWGWDVRVDLRLAELDFGRWDGLPWTGIAWSEVEAWQAALLHHRPGGGESLAQLAQRVQAFVAEARSAGAVRLVVTHGGWLNALALLPNGLPPPAPGLPLPPPPQPPVAALTAQDWPPPPRHGTRVAWPPEAARHRQTGRGVVSSRRGCRSSQSHGGAAAACR